MSGPLPPWRGGLGRALAWVLLLVSVPACLGGGLLSLFAFVTLSQQLGRPVAPGQVVAAERRSGDSVAPVIEYRTPDGETRRVAGNIANDSPSWRIGDPMGVRYDPDAPAEAIPDTFWSIWLFPLMLGVPGAMLLLPGLATVALARRRLRRRGPPAAAGAPLAAAMADGAAPPSRIVLAKAGPGGGGQGTAPPPDAAPAPASAPASAGPPDRPVERRPPPVAPGEAATRRDRSRALFLVVLALLFGGDAARRFVNGLEYRQRTVTAPGHVAELVRTGRRGSDSYAPVFRFRTEAGREIRARQAWSSGLRFWSVGETATIRYDPAHPEEGAPDTPMAQWGTPIVQSNLAVLFLLLAAAAVLPERRRARHRARLWEEGVPVQAGPPLVEEGRAADDAPVWTVTAAWDEPGRGRRWVFESLPLREDPAPLLRGRETVTVLVHPADPAVYAMQRPGDGEPAGLAG
ncbi:DUF3592 domain-containing protein [Roseomonas sp. NAR14]|uniref:DUF3592 domain-containing protein n=1 Tax=Roseomonas acroporae TaxID=2937791 RepID=A0A9X1YB67_9PROT|nr:DUF3592 domain-containing protein [Roseomonas acroporae]MCK8787534.1 DUF3592 domain-containing protein [Roseomonas acroporae]